MVNYLDTKTREHQGPDHFQNSLRIRCTTFLKDSSGELRGGMFIPEEQLAQQFGVSRTPIREAIRRLAEYGLVVLKPRSHAQVYQINDKEARDIARVRVVLERLAVESMTPQSINERIDQLARLAADCQYYLGIGNRAALFENTAFHLELVRCATTARYTTVRASRGTSPAVREAQNLPTRAWQIHNQQGQLLRSP